MKNKNKNQFLVWKKSKPAVVLENELEYWREKKFICAQKKKSMTQAIEQEEFRVWERKKERNVMRDREEKSRYSSKITKKSFLWIFN